MTPAAFISNYRELNSGQISLYHRQIPPNIRAMRPAKAQADRARLLNTSVYASDIAMLNAIAAALRMNRSAALRWVVQDFHRRLLEVK